MKQKKALTHNFSFAKGFWLLFGFGESRTEELRRSISRRSDAEALAGDWKAIGSDMSKALRKAECNY